jgi:formate dehydrogenase iron-sulfur subunit
MRYHVPCDSAAVSVGADDVAAWLEGQGHEVVRTSSRGMFWLEPLVEIDSPEGRVGFGPVAPGDRLEDRALGLVAEIPYLKAQERLIFARAGITDPLNLSDYQAHGGLAALRAARTMDPADICRAVLDSGLRGRGGAGFPAGIKWETVRTQPGPKFVCCNADEGDSGTFADRMVMEGDPFLLIEGMAIAARATGAERGFVYIRSEYPTAIARMKAAIGIMRNAGWLDGFDLQVRRGAGAYICGEESSMLESLEGRRGTVRAKPPIPAISGLHGRPTLVNNVLTLASVPWILTHGAAAYRDYGMGRSSGTQPFQLAGNIARGGLVEKAFGVTLRELLEDFGGGTATGRPFRAAQLGGPLGAYVGAGMLDLAMEYETLAEAGAMLGHGGITVFDETVDMARMARFAFDFCAIESCGKCTPCRVGAVRGRETVDRILRGERVAENIALIEDLAEVMRDGSLCAMGGLTPMPVLSAIRLFPEDFDRAPSIAAE